MVFLRTNANFFGVASMTVALWYLRASTTTIIQNIHPVLVLIMSFLILKEKFYIRYIYGIICCFIGVLIIVLNETKIKLNNMVKITNTGRSIGLFFSTIDLFFISSARVANKIMVNNKVPISTQMYYVSICTMIYSSIYNGSKLKNFLLGDKMLMCLLHGIFFYLSNVALNSALKYCPLSKIILYIYIVFYFFT